MLLSQFLSLFASLQLDEIAAFETCFDLHIYVLQATSCAQQAGFLIPLSPFHDF